MILRHRKRVGYIVEKGFMGREKKIEKEYLYEKHLGVVPLADHVSGKSWGTGIPTHTGVEIFHTRTSLRNTTTLQDTMRYTR